MITADTLLVEDILSLRTSELESDLPNTAILTLCNLALDRRHTNPQYAAARVKVAEILKRRAA